MSGSQRGGTDPGSAHDHHHRVEGESTSNTVEEPRTIESHSATELTDDIDLINIRDDDDDDDEDGDSFCDADDTSSPDINCLRREMSVTRDDLEDFIVEFGDEIAEAANAYYDDENGDKIAVPRSHVVPIEEGREQEKKQNGGDTAE